MGFIDRASNSRPRARFLHSIGAASHAALLAALSVGSLTAYAGCSSSSTPGGGNDSGAPEKDASTPPVDSTAPDAPAVDAPVTLPDATEPVDQDAPGGDDAGDATPPGMDCSHDDGGSGLPNDLFCTGLYSDWGAKTVATGILPYTPGYVLWSDGANKARFIYLPPGTQIDTTDMDNWVFPIGTKIWKEFSLGPQRIETRIFQKNANGTENDWVWATFRWSSDGVTSATKLDSGQTDVNGTTYEIPSRGQCTQCHGGRPDMVLGFEALTLGASTAAGTTMANLIAANRFTTNPPASIEIPEDSSGNARAPLGWLHMNCGVTCHNDNPDALAYGTGLYLKTSAAQIVAGGGAVTVPELDPYKTAVDVVPNMAPFAGEGFFRIYPGQPDKSLIPTLDGARNVPGTPQMPPIISHVPDAADVTKLKTWIQTMPIPDGGVLDSGSPSDAGSD